MSLAGSGTFNGSTRPTLSLKNIVGDNLSQMDGLISRKTASGQITDHQAVIPIYAQLSVDAKISDMESVIHEPYQIGEGIGYY